MKKQELIKKEIGENKQAFGRWCSDKKINSADYGKLLHESPPKSEEEALQHSNALANTGNYPVGTNECFSVGISGGCGTDCFVYLKGECDEEEEMIGLELKQ